jgi:uncharacterized protein (TIGR02271 family)
MSDYRDTNHDGHVSLTEKIKDKLHLHRKHKKKGARTSDSAEHSYPIAQPVNHTAASTSTGLNQNHHTSMGEKLAGPTGATGVSALAAGSASSSNFDSHDLNRDGHVSTNERLQAVANSHASDSSDFTHGAHRTGIHDSRDLDRDGHVSMSEKLAADTGMENEQARVRLHEEQLAVSKRAVSAGAVDLVKRVHEEQVQHSVPVMHQEIVMERRPYSGDDSSRVPEKDEIARVVLYREEVVTEKRLVPNEEVVVRKDVVTDQATVGATLRSEYIETSQMEKPSAYGAYGYAGDVSPGKRLKADDNAHMKAARG